VDVVDLRDAVHTARYHLIRLSGSGLALPASGRLIIFTVKIDGSVPQTMQIHYWPPNSEETRSLQPLSSGTGTRPRVLKSFSCEARFGPGTFKRLGVDWRANAGGPACRPRAVWRPRPASGAPYTCAPFFRACGLVLFMCNVIIIVITIIPAKVQRFSMHENVKTL